MKGPTATDEAPGFHPSVELVVHRLDVDLRRILGDGAVYCLVISREVAGISHVQALTNCTAEHAHQLLRAADACGFDSLN